MIIKKIFDGDFDDEIHNDFVKFSRGDFKDRYLIQGKKQANKWAIKTGPEFVNHVVRYFLPKAGESVPVTGIISTTLDIADEATFKIEKVSQFQGVKKLILKTEVNPKEILGLMDKYPKAFFALSFKGTDSNIKIRAKSPKAGKSGKEKDGETVADFCTIKTNDQKFLDDIFWGIDKGWTTLNVSHEIKIDGIVYPRDMTGMKPAEIRKESKRKGILIRKVNFDGKCSERETSLLA